MADLWWPRFEYEIIKKNVVSNDMWPGFARFIVLGLADSVLVFTGKVKRKTVKRSVFQFR